MEAQRNATVGEYHGTVAHSDGKVFVIVSFVIFDYDVAALIFTANYLTCEPHSFISWCPRRWVLLSWEKDLNRKNENKCLSPMCTVQNPRKNSFITEKQTRRCVNKPWPPPNSLIEERAKERCIWKIPRPLFPTCHSILQPLISVYTSHAPRIAWFFQQNQLRTLELNHRSLRLGHQHWYRFHFGSWCRCCWDR